MVDGNLFKAEGLVLKYFRKAPWSMYEKGFGWCTKCQDWRLNDTGNCGICNRKLRKKPYGINLRRYEKRLGIIHKDSGERMNIIPGLVQEFSPTPPEECLNKPANQ